MIHENASISSYYARTLVYANLRHASTKMSSVSSDMSVADTFVPTPTKARVNASLEPAKIIFFFTVAESGALKEGKGGASQRKSKRREKGA